MLCCQNVLPMILIHDLIQNSQRGSLILLGLVVGLFHFLGHSKLALLDEKDPFNFSVIL